MPNKMSVPFVNLGLQYLDLKEEILAKIDKLSSSGQYILGEEVTAFEKGLAKTCETEHAIAVANGTDALILILKALGIGDGDEVITVPNSFIATAGAIGLVGAKPVFVDVADDYNIDSTLIESAITSKTKAILPVHLTGNPADMDSINEIARKYHLKVIEDAAQAIGAKYDGRPVGSLGDAAAFSLHPLKNLHLMGDAGFIATNDSELAQSLRQWQNHGLINRDESVHWGMNSRLDALHAGIGNIKLNHFNRINKRFIEIGQRYHSELKSTVNCPVVSEKSVPVFHNFVIRTQSEAERNSLMAFLDSQGVETKIHYPIPLHLMKCSEYLEHQVGDFPQSEAQAKTIVSLPIYPELTDKQVDLVIEKVKQFYQTGQV